MKTVTTTIIWNGPAVRNKILASMYPRVVLAANYYRDYLLLAIMRWGSTSIGGGLRRVINYSAPGNAPFRQTGNLYNSIKVNIQPFNYLEQIIGEISTDVPYAPTLELGGTLQIDQNDKIHTSERLIHPIPVDKPVTILPRPAWIPVFRQTFRAMLDILRTGHP